MKNTTDTTAVINLPGYQQGKSGRVHLPKPEDRWHFSQGNITYDFREYGTIMGRIIENVEEWISENSFKRVIHREYAATMEDPGCEDSSLTKETSDALFAMLLDDGIYVPEIGSGLRICVKLLNESAGGEDYCDEDFDLTQDSIIVKETGEPATVIYGNFLG